MGTGEGRGTGTGRIRTLGLGMRLASSRRKTSLASLTLGRPGTVMPGGGPGSGMTGISILPGTPMIGTGGRPTTGIGPHGPSTQAPGGGGWGATRLLARSRRM